MERTSKLKKDIETNRESEPSIHPPTHPAS